MNIWGKVIIAVTSVAMLIFFLGGGFERWGLADVIRVNSKC